MGAGQARGAGCEPSGAGGGFLSRWKQSASAGGALIPNGRPAPSQPLNGPAPRYRYRVHFHSRGANDPAKALPPDRPPILDRTCESIGGADGKALGLGFERDECLPPLCLEPPTPRGYLCGPCGTVAVPTPYLGGVFRGRCGISLTSVTSSLQRSTLL